jgi:two-component system, sensor histidine kinase YesM
MKGSIRKKLLLSMLVAVLIPFIVSNLITYYSTSNTMEEYQIQTNQSLIDSGLENLVYYLNEVDQLSLTWVYDEKLHNLIKIPSLNYGEQAILEYDMKNLLYQKPEVLMVKFYKESSGLTYYGTRSNFYDREERESTLNQKLKGQTFRLFEIGELNGREVLEIHRKIVDMPKGDLLGYLSIYVSVEELKRILDRLYEDGEKVYLTFGTDTSTFYTPIDIQVSKASYSKAIQIQERKAAYLEVINSINKRNSSQGTETTEIDNTEITVFYENERIGDVNLSLVKFVPSTLIKEGARKPLKTVLWIQIAALILVVLFVSLVAYSMTEPIQRLNATIGLMEKGTFAVKKKPKRARNDELGVLEERFNDMVRRLNDLINKEYRLQLDVTTARLKMLQAQINPHFLFNTLQSIGTIAIKNNVPEVYERLTSLSMLFRYSMNVHTGPVPLKRELENAEEYLYLQQGRFKNRLTHKVECEDEALKVKVPKMILQPLVENSIVHGMERNNQQCEIKLEVRLEADRLLLTVIDNGEGFTPEKIKEIRNTYLNRQLANKGDSGIGLLNVLFRLYFEYGEEFDWEISSKPFERVAITLKIPLQKDGDAKNEGLDC